MTVPHPQYSITLCRTLCAPIISIQISLDYSTYVLYLLPHLSSRLYVLIKVIMECYVTVQYQPSILDRQCSTDKWTDKSTDSENRHYDGPQEGEQLFWYLSVVSFRPCLVDKCHHMLRCKGEKESLVCGQENTIHQTMNCSIVFAKLWVTHHFAVTKQSLTSSRPSSRDSFE